MLNFMSLVSFLCMMEYLIFAKYLARVSWLMKLFVNSRDLHRELHWLMTFWFIWWNFNLRVSVFDIPRPARPPQNVRTARIPTFVILMSFWRPARVFMPWFCCFTAVKAQLLRRLWCIALHEYWYIRWTHWEVSQVIRTRLHNYCGCGSSL